MPTQDEINEALYQNLLGPKRVTVGQETVEAHSPRDFLEAAAAVGGTEAVDNGRSGLRFFQFQPPGAGGTP